MASTFPVARRDAHRTITLGEGGDATGVAAAAEPMTPPIHKTDPYGWLRDDDRADEEVLAHLRAENAHTKRMQTERTGIASVADTLFHKMLRLQRESQMGLPLPAWSHDDEWGYYTRQAKGQGYVKHCRINLTEHPEARAATRAFTEATGPVDIGGRIYDDDRPFVPAGEQVLLDVGAVAVGRTHCDVHVFGPSRDHTLFAFATDFKGDETYTLHVCDMLPSGDLVPREHDVIPDVAVDFEWAPAGAASIYYVKFDDAHRPCEAWRHVLGEPASRDVRVWREDDEEFTLGLGTTDTDEHVMIHTGTSVTSESRLVVGTRAFVLWPREHGVRYQVEPLAPGSREVLLLTNRGAVEGRVCTSAWAPPSAVGAADADGAPPLLLPPKRWVDCVSGAWRLDTKATVSLDGIAVHKGFVALTGRGDGAAACWVLSTHALGPAAVPINVTSIGRGASIPAGAVVELSGRFTPAWDSRGTVAVTWSTMTTPDTTVMMRVRAGAGGGTAATVLDIPRVVLRAAVPHYDPAAYGSVLIEVPSRDGRTRVPVSLAFKRSRFDPAKASPHHAGPPCILYGYGAYGVCIDADFSSGIVPLLDAGVMYAIAHVRGGGARGRAWYETEGRLGAKMNTFTDFLDVAQHLKDNGLASSVAIYGGSAGGLLVGAALNLAPQGLIDAAITRVPFVDVLATMSDSGIPLTAGEWQEWGNPHDAAGHRDIAAYSPIDNVDPDKEYPPTFVTAGLHDRRVGYWEPAKWVAQLRHSGAGATADRVFFECELDTGHFSASDKYKHLRERAKVLAFALWHLWGGDRAALQRALSGGGMLSRLATLRGSPKRARVGDGDGSVVKPTNARIEVMT